MVSGFCIAGTKSWSNFFFLIYFSFDCIGSSLLCVGFSLRWLVLLQSAGSRRAGFSSSGSWAQ